MRHKRAVDKPVLCNPWRGKRLPQQDALAAGEVETDARAAIALFAACPTAAATPLVEAPELARKLGIASLQLKDERQRMGLGCFKALGAVHAIAKRAAAVADIGDAEGMARALRGETFICASAGNHGLSVAAGARLFGAQAVVLLAETVPEEFAERLRTRGARVMRAGNHYEESMEVSKQLAAERGWNLLSDGSWEGYSDPARDVMEGYLVMGHEAANQMGEPPTHVFLQAGVGGLAAGMTAAVRVRWGDDVTVVIVEPAAAPALYASIEAGKVVDTIGPVSSMGRLDCKTPSHLALKYLAREADFFQLVGDEQVDETLRLMAVHGAETTPSGGAGVGGLHHIGGDRETTGLTPSSRCYCIISEQA
ncbi:MAG: pyridoxal-phosphate dependent enzyme [Rhizobiaceae bacterium]